MRIWKDDYVLLPFNAFETKNDYRTSNDNIDADKHMMLLLIRLTILNESEILETDRIIHEETDVLICFIGRLSTRKKDGEPNEDLEPIEGIEDFKYVILDEVHMLTAPNLITGLMSLRPYRILCVHSNERRTKCNHRNVRWIKCNQCLTC